MSSESPSKIDPNPQERLQQSGRIILQSKDDSISLKQLTPEDADRYFQLVDSSREHLSQNGEDTAKKYPTLETVRESIVHPKNQNRYRFGIWDGNTMVGSDNLTLKDVNRAELGSWIAKEYTGNRYAARARKLLVDFAFSNLHLDEVFCEIACGNKASIRSVESSGFTLSGQHDAKWIYTLRNPKSEAAQS